MGDLTKAEAKKLLKLHRHQEGADKFLDACSGMPQGIRPLLPCARGCLLCCREMHPALSGQPHESLLGGYKAMDLVRTCQRYAVDAKQAPKAQKADMEKRARKEVIQGSVQDRCGNTGKDTLKKLVANRKAGIEKGAEELCTIRSGSERRIVTP